MIASRDTGAERPRILIVEDTADAVSIALVEGSWDILVARDGAEALRCWEDHRPHLLVFDLLLPGAMDGIDIFQAIRRRTGARPRALIVSSAREAAACARALDIPVVRKPIAHDDLIRAMRHALDS